jgi:transposase
MYVEETKKRVGEKQYRCFMLRESFRENGKVRKRTIANISHLPHAEIVALREALSQKQAGVQPEKLQTGKIVGTALVINELLNRLGITSALGSSRLARLCSWLIFSRVVEQGSRLSSVRLSERHEVNLLGLGKFDENDLYDALAWIAREQEAIQQSLFKHRYDKQAPRLFLYDLTSSYLEGTHNAFAMWGYNRDGKNGKMQMVFGLLTDKDGEPIAVEVFEGNTADQRTFVKLVTGFGKRFGVKEVVFVGDRGMIKSTGIDAVHAENFKYITAITKPQIETLLNKGTLQLNLFDSDLHEVLDGDVRYVLRKNPYRAEEVAASRKSKLEKLQQKAQAASTYLSQHAKASPQKAVDRLKATAERLKINKLVEIEYADGKLNVKLLAEAWESAAQLDGCYALKTDVMTQELDIKTIHERYKDLAKVERGFRTMKTGLLEVRPVWLREKQRTSGHVFICMLAYMVSRQLEKLTTGEETVKDVIEELNRVSSLDFDVNGEKQRCIPQPPPRAAQLLAGLGIPLTISPAVSTKRQA